MRKNENYLIAFEGNPSDLHNECVESLVESILETKKLPKIFLTTGNRFVKKLLEIGPVISNHYMFHKFVINYLNGTSEEYLEKDLPIPDLTFYLRPKEKHLKKDYDKALEIFNEDRCIITINSGLNNDYLKAVIWGRFSNFLDLQK